ncbi:hypothetical protein ColLi_05503 [Colletotrichum liriopes]|uniref:Uncharacterized protein n=1 Tax=Colletotrichum liriopes TaxID=708192 RepID=A0AA37GL79_9PEZI|nr:hypothetical protein ColLi_05503 [Colletotrichum liriopes]
MFDPKAILESLPTSEALDTSPGLAVAAAHSISNDIRVNQPRSGFPSMNSDQFLVDSEWAEQFAKNIREYEASDKRRKERKWQLEVVIDLGLGVPSLLGLALYLTKQQTARHTAPSSLDK